MSLYEACCTELLKETTGRKPPDHDVEPKFKAGGLQASKKQFLGHENYFLVPWRAPGPRKASERPFGPEIQAGRLAGSQIGVFGYRKLFFGSPIAARKPLASFSTESLCIGCIHLLLFIL